MDKTIEYLIDLLKIYGIDTEDADVQQNILNCAVVIENAK